MTPNGSDNMAPGRGSGISATFGLADRLLGGEPRNTEVVGLVAYDPSRDTYLLLEAGARSSPSRRHGDEDLSVRELQVLQLVAGGHSNGEVASKLSISLNTTKRHLQSIFLRLGAGSRSEAVAMAIREGWLRFA